MAESATLISFAIATSVGSMVHLVAAGLGLSAVLATSVTAFASGHE